MALQSKLFRGDPKLEPAAVSDPAHIFQGASGPHVVKIQQALNQLDGAALAQDGIYGPRTAAAVSAFKRKRQILNFKNEIDDIVGKKTTTTLDTEMLAKERGDDPTPVVPPLTTSSILLCPHGGRIQAFGGPVSTTPSGQQILTIAHAFLILNCPVRVLREQLGPLPCVAVKWVTANQQVLVNGVPSLDVTSLGLCIDGRGFPAGAVTIAAP
jgi:hypothetical protein